jgi:hypothetical protein
LGWRRPWEYLEFCVHWLTTLEFEHLLPLP